MTVTEYEKIAFEIAGKDVLDGKPYYNSNTCKVELDLAPATMDLCVQIIVRLKDRGWIEVENCMSEDPSYVVLKHPEQMVIAVVEYIHFWRTDEEKCLTLYVGYNEVDDIEYFEDPHELCPLGGDITDDCADCPYAGDYHYVDGECVIRDLDDEDDYAEMQSMADQVDGVKDPEYSDGRNEEIPMIPCSAK